jgi:hypothetical protein
MKKALPEAVLIQINACNMRTILFFLLFISISTFAQDDFLGPDTSVCDNSFVIESGLDSTEYDISWNTGDTSTSIKVFQEGNYWIRAFSSVDTLRDTINISLRLPPIADFSTEEKCFDEEIPVFNRSTYLRSGSTVTYKYVGNEIISQDSVVFFPPLAEGDSVTLWAIIEQANGCRDSMSVVLESLVTPDAGFEIDSTCENEVLLLNNTSSDIDSSSLFSLRDSNGFFFQGRNLQSNYNLDFLSAGTYDFSMIVENANGCADTVGQFEDIYPVTQASFSGLLDEYCFDYPPSTLMPTPSGGIFISDLVDNETFFPREVGEDFAVVYRYTNQYGCIDADTQIVRNIYPLPVLSVQGLEMEYCQGDSSSTLMGNQSGAEFELQTNLEVINSTEAIFTPTDTGQFLIQYDYTDQNGCYNQWIDSTIVHPLPTIDIQNEYFLDLGGSVSIGVNNPDPEVDFVWSNGATTSTIEVEQPGIYVLEAMNRLTTCSSTDTIVVKLATSNSELYTECTVFPNPTSDVLNIASDTPIKSIFLFDQFLRPVQTNYQKRFSLEGDAISLNISGVAEGVYFLKINEEYWIKFIKTE